jgi:hypothetical protein
LRVALTVALSVALFAAPRATRAQGGGSLISLDRLQIISLGASVGRILPEAVLPATLFSTQADYGPISQRWRLSFSVSYWQSQYRDDVVQTFVDSLRKSLSDTSARILPSRINVFDVTFGGDARYTPVLGSVGILKPFIGAGGAAHVINAEGKLIKGTFIERSLDDISFGVYGVAGLALRFTRSVGIEGSVRADLVGGLRSIQARAGGTYYFGRIRGM